MRLPTFNQGHGTMNPQKIDRHRLDHELLKYFLEHEMTIRREDPSLFWRIIDRLTTSPTLNPSPGHKPGFFNAMMIY